MSGAPSLLLVGHGTRSARGVADYWAFAEAVRAEAPGLDVGCGFIELAEPDLDTAVDRLVAGGAGAVVAVPLVLLGAGHMKNDGPAALARGRRRHPGVAFSYARDLGVHPLALSVAEDRIRSALGAEAGAAAVLVGRGSSDPDANADLWKVARLLADGRGLGAAGPGGQSVVEPAFVSLAEPSVPVALERARRLGARCVAVVPYFLFHGLLVDRLHAQARAWAGEHPDVEVAAGPYLGPDRRLAALVLERYAEAAAGAARMNCDCCVYRTGLPGHEDKVGRPVHAHGPHDHHH